MAPHARTTVREPAREVPVAESCDLCVLGGSTTGVFAAVAAARRGAKVALVEALGCFGGTATSSLVLVWHAVFDTAWKTQIAAGLPLELIDRLKRRNAVIERTHSPNWQFAFNPAEMAIDLDGMVLDAGVRPFLHARFAAPVMDEARRMTHAVIEDKSGRRAIEARVFIDATGDADVAHRMGLECYTQPHLQPPTTTALIQGLDTLKDLDPGFNLRRDAFDPKFPEALPPGFLWDAPLPGTRDLRMVAGTRVHGADCSDADDLTRAEVEGRRQVRAICDLVRNHAEGGRACALVGLPARIGIRQSRQVRCLHRLTEREVLHGARFEDAIANGSYRVDVHSDRGGGIVLRYLDGTETLVMPGGREQRRWRDPVERDPTFYQIPYRSLVPRGAANVLVAGRCLDADEGAFGALRVMINCSQTGEAAGTAAWLALDSDRDVADVDTEALRRSLRERGAIVL